MCCLREYLSVGVGVGVYLLMTLQKFIGHLMRDTGQQQIYIHSKDTQTQTQTHTHANVTMHRVAAVSALMQMIITYSPVMFFVGSNDIQIAIYGGAHRNIVLTSQNILVKNQQANLFKNIYIFLNSFIYFISFQQLEIFKLHFLLNLKKII